MTRYFRFNGDELTRGEYGVRITGGHTTEADPDHISVFDSDFGDSIYGSVDSCLESGEWVEVDRAEWESQ